MFVKPMSLTLFITGVLFAAAPAVVAADWRQQEASINAQIGQNNYTNVATTIVSALQGAQAERVSRTDPSMQRLMYADIPRTVLWSGAAGNHQNAETIAKWKKYVAANLYGADSAPAMDAEFDICLAQMTGKSKQEQEAIKEQYNAKLKALATRNPTEVREALRLMLKKDALLMGSVQQKLNSLADRLGTSQ